jgi:hypothetical protein
MLIALGKDPAYVMAQLGHADPKFTLHVYTHMMLRSDEEREPLRVLGRGRGFRHQRAPVPKPPRPAPNPTEVVKKKSRLGKRAPRHSFMGAVGFEPATSRV